MKKIDVDPFSWKQKIQERLLESSVVLRIARGASQLMADLPFEPDELLVHVLNKLKLMDMVHERNLTLFGRLINKITREELDYIVLDGIAVRQLYEFADETLPLVIDVSSRYEIHREAVRALYNRAQTAIASSTSEEGYGARDVQAP